jgi:hypothetical protein
MSAAIVPGLLLAAASLALAARSLCELSWRAPLDAEAFARELTRYVSCGHETCALGLCDALRSAWGAELAGRALRAVTRDGEALALVVEELELEYAHASERGMHGLAAVQRVAIPLALGVTIVVLGGGFDAGGPSGIAASDAQRSLQTALQALSLGLATWVLSRLGLSVVRQQASARLAEVRRVIKALSALDHALGKYSA